MKSIAELRADRLRAGLSQRRVAEAMGTTQSALSRAEREGNPTQSFLRRYEDALSGLTVLDPADNPAASASDSVLEIATMRMIAGDIARRHHVAELYIYGSVARGEARPDSDVDLLYRMEPGAPRGMTAMRALSDDLSAALGRKVSLTSYDSLLRHAADSRASRRFLDHIRPDLVKVA
ncbi:nucleotidyltransferase domain-containing protein [Bifidobacterium avesanii]|uniref:Helix-turn-helix domain-containing protein n=1 Tax=Bifidobacterium avesanii TaxID=1798157 RepID=A0A7K3THX5_9BIFI|nr:nucleotidyltransferase domain-containing protein [Bifidobacterium avesanii]KAB8293633.1 nucleotidyltransferase [Bifidobacterium avesanii]NEG78230.1 helix-turn-helix domain-containing protein [Bifidobacterium avesanii]